MLEDYVYFLFPRKIKNRYKMLEWVKSYAWGCMADVDVCPAPLLLCFIVMLGKLFGPSVSVPEKSKPALRYKDSPTLSSPSW